MIPLRPTINLYYDKIIDNTPVPNGVTEYNFTKDLLRIPVSAKKHWPINDTTLLFNVLKVLDVERVNIFSGNETAKSLFYPLELNKGNSWYDLDFETIIPNKSLSKIRKGKMKLLIFAPRLSHDYRVLWKLRTQLDKLGAKKITRDKIYIVLGDLNRSYRKLFDNPNVYGIDWWQIFAQLAYKNRDSEKSMYWVYREPSFFPLSPEQIDKEDFKFENWKPKRVFTAYTGNNARHNLAFISELIYRQLDVHGKYSFNLTKEKTPINSSNFRIIDKTNSTEYVRKKEQLIKSLTGTKKLDYDFNTLRRTPLVFDKSDYEDSLISIVSGPYSPMFDRSYMDEVNMLSPKLGIWRQIAKGHPFMALGCLNTMGYIGGEGYFLPTLITNHFYDRVSKTTDKVKLMCDSIEIMSQYTEQEMADKVEELIPFMKKNKQKFFNMKHQRKFEKLFSEMNYE